MLERARDYLLRSLPNLGGIVLDSSGLGKVLGELAIGRDTRSTIGMHGTTSHTGRAGVDGQHVGVAHHRLRLFFGRCCDGPVEVRLVRAGLDRVAVDVVDDVVGVGRAADFRSRNVLR